MTTKNAVEEITIDSLQTMTREARRAALDARYDWLKEQRKNDKRLAANKERRKWRYRNLDKYEKLKLKKRKSKIKYIDRVEMYCTMDVRASMRVRVHEDTKIECDLCITCRGL